MALIALGSAQSVAERIKSQREPKIDSVDNAPLISVTRITEPAVVSVLWGTSNS
jgi:hypothetical protein